VIHPLTLCAIYFAGIFLELVLSRLGWIRARYETKDTALSLTMFCGHFLISSLLFGLYAVVATFVFKYRIFTFDMRSPWCWSLLIVLEDFTYYWTHRTLHERRIWWLVHVNHHTSQHFNLSTALRQSWLTEITGAMWIPWLWLSFLGFPLYAVALQKTLNLAYQVWLHIEHVGKLPRPIEAIFNTPSHHRVHHSRHEKFLGRNYAGTFIVWDKLFGTYADEGAERTHRYGLVDNIGTFNLFRVLFHELVFTIREAWHLRSPVKVARFLFGKMEPRSSAAKIFSVSP
jgi:sterol desaturase/sphingolipid hydroxylase (fatty acid hydroxylase superfamily)